MNTIKMTRRYLDLTNNPYAFKSYNPSLVNRDSMAQQHSLTQHGNRPNSAPQNNYRANTNVQRPATSKPQVNTQKSNPPRILNSYLSTQNSNVTRNVVPTPVVRTIVPQEDKMPTKENYKNLNDYYINNDVQFKF